MSFSDIFATFPLRQRKRPASEARIVSLSGSKPFLQRFDPP
jgi:hypothetical protein